MNSKTVSLRVIEDNSSVTSKEYLKLYFKEYLKCEIPSSMPCPCCKRLMVRPKERHTEEYKQRHRYMIGTIIKGKNVLGLIAICEDCYNKGLKQDIQVFEEVVVKCESQQLTFLL